MAPVTEIATIPLQAGASIEDPESHAGKIWISTIDTIADQQGFQRLYYGRQVENPHILQLLVDWDSLEKHQQFINSAIYGVFLKHLTSITDGPVDLRHATFNPHPPSKVLGSSPVTEVLTAYLATKDGKYAERSAKFASILESEAEACTGTSTGWIVEEVEHEKIGGNKKGHAYVSVIGWESKEKHAEFRETSTFKDNIQMCREGCKGTTLFHVAFKAK